MNLKNRFVRSGTHDEMHMSKDIWKFIMIILIDITNQTKIEYIRNMYEYKN